MHVHVDLQSLFGLLVHSCTHWLRPRNPPPRPPPPPYGRIHTKALLVSQDRRHPPAKITQIISAIAVLKSAHAKRFQVVVFYTPLKTSRIVLDFGTTNKSYFCFTSVRWFEKARKLKIKITETGKFRYRCVYPFKLCSSWACCTCTVCTC